MRFNNYINEERNMSEELLDVLLKDCGKYLREIRYGKKGWLYRGTFNDSTDIKFGLMKKQSHLIDRKPRVAGYLLHTLTNKAGKEIFGWPIRNGVASIGTKGSTFSFGEMRIFLPIGDYEYVWSPVINDFNYGTDSVIEKCNKKDFKKVNEYSEFLYCRKNTLLDKLKNRNYKLDDVVKNTYPLIHKFVNESYKNDNLLDAIKSKNEVSIKCNEYYLALNENMIHSALELGGFR